MSNRALAVPLRRDASLVGRLSSDERLASLVSRGNARAFELLYERHRSALHRYCRSILRNEEDTQDALQSAMTSALAALRTSEREIAVRPWLFRIAHNEAISLLRLRRPTDGPVDEHAPDSANVEHAAEERERLATLVADLQSLGERHRAALVMRELSGLSIDEIAVTLSISPGAAKQALFEARCALHELVAGRAMECQAVRRIVSACDGRVLRGRKVRAHLRACPGCRDFRNLIGRRSADLRLLAPPLSALAATRWLAGGGAGAGTTAGGQALAPLAAKAIAGMAILAAATSATAPLRLLHRKPAPAPVPAPATATRTPATAFGTPSASTPAHGVTRTGAATPRRGGARRRATAHAPALPTVDSSGAAPPAPSGAGVTAPPRTAATSPPAGAGTAAAADPRISAADPPASAPAAHGPPAAPPGLAKRAAPPPGLAKHGDPPPGLAKRGDPPPAQAPSGGGDPAPAAPAKPSHGNGNGPPASAPGQQKSHGKP